MTSHQLLDTDIIIDYLRGHKSAAAFFDKSKAQLSISVITIAELYAGVRGNEEKEILQQFLKLFNIIELNHDIAIQGGHFRREYSPKYGTGLADALIAASALHHSAELVTLNKRHFPMLDHIMVPYTK